ncbi:MAG: class I SAM-dependent DNA methyltransferase [Bacteroidetes bacterium]|nr:MAG: class I SAM-dependent DNA methyltransferase [Bacteroidota bacterium]
MNMRISEKFGNYFTRIPLKKFVSITHGNALQLDWNSLIYGSYQYVTADELNINIISEPITHFDTLNVKAKKINIIDENKFQEKDIKHKTKFDYILGNPPFIGKSLQTKEQKEDLKFATKGLKGASVLDYVACWYLKAAEYIQETKIKAAFVSTNSIAQGEQVGILWNEMFLKYKIKIHFAHRTFRWDNEAKANAAVHVVIIGFANFDVQNKSLYDYEDIKSEAHKIKVKNINPYLIEGNDIVVLKQRKSICNANPISFGSMPNDGGHLLFTNDEKIEFLQKEPLAEPFIRSVLSAREFLNNQMRWCLWLTQITPSEIRKLKEVSKRVELVKEHRESSTREATKRLAQFPTLFGENRQPSTDYILIPRHSSENRKYIPFGFFSKDYIASDSCSVVTNAKLLDFGLMTSEMHMTWVKYTCGRIKSDYRYSNEVVYNNYPFPKEIKDKQKEKVEKAAQLVLDVREKYPDSSLADLYDPLAMPPDLVKAHQQLDKAVDLCYRPQAFTNERTRIEFLFDLYSEYVTPLQAAVKKVGNKKVKRK